MRGGHADAQAHRQTDKSVCMAMLAQGRTDIQTDRQSGGVLGYLRGLQRRWRPDTGTWPPPGGGPLPAPPFERLGGLCWSPEHRHVSHDTISIGIAAIAISWPDTTVSSSSDISSSSSSSSSTSRTYKVTISPTRTGPH